ncbi:hypothetical protein HC028_26630 [Planosporangium flavigriseum]|uniref:Uncharacterized protein n=1 Tax=Planosporangium flavigriseum TaxID=373681 RepID=A0A8J3LRP6_9ACTN|nr:hypothetical protein [Planosporangium flavigriseum]NJC68054.1 hypothetical protein [Planosporangium flavigriseum]GIG76807.1 hypothetical protein Pfl04_52110 [Planosporangium flavigriseum]
MTSPPALTPLLTLIDSPGTSSVEYVIGGTTLSGAAREAAAQLLADDAMTIACGKSPVLDRWRARRDGGPPETGAKLEAVKTYVAIAFNLPGKPVNDDHVQGHVAELLWNRLIHERTVCRDGRKLVRAHPVKADPLEPGGDGLVVYQNEQGTLVFRLWEIKKHAAQQGVSATINRASKQLSSRGHEYLAKLAGPETIIEDEPLGELYGNMVELWFDRSERAGVGVSVGTSAHHAPTRPQTFHSINKAFPEFARAGQTESVIVAIPDFPGFAERVKEIVWSGL